MKQKTDLFTTGSVVAEGTGTSFSGMESGDPLGTALVAGKGSSLSSSGQEKASFVFP